MKTIPEELNITALSSNALAKVEQYGYNDMAVNANWMDF